MGGCLTARADVRANLDFDEPATPRLVTNRAVERIHEIRTKDPHVAAELNVLCYGRRNHHLLFIRIRTAPSQELRRNCTLDLPHDEGDEGARPGFCLLQKEFDKLPHAEFKKLVAGSTTSRCSGPVFVTAKSIETGFSTGFYRAIEIEVIVDHLDLPSSSRRSAAPTLTQRGFSPKLSQLIS